jgi:hypothetical protein
MRPFLTVWGAWLLVMAGANLATALYALYARQFHFSSLVLTTIFATYAVVLVPARRTRASRGASRSRASRLRCSDRSSACP